MIIFGDFFLPKKQTNKKTLIIKYGKNCQPKYNTAFTTAPEVQINRNFSLALL